MLYKSIGRRRTIMNICYGSEVIGDDDIVKIKP